MRFNRVCAVVGVTAVLGAVYLAGRWSGRASVVGGGAGPAEASHGRGATQHAESKLEEVLALRYRANQLQAEIEASRDDGGARGGGSVYMKWALITTFDCTRFDKTQVAAFDSWDRLVPRPHIYVLSQCLPEVLKGKANLIPHFDETFDHLPLFSGMMFHTLLTAAVESMAVVAWVNADILLAANVAVTITQALQQQKIPWLLLGSRHNIPYRKLYSREAAPKNMARFILEQGTAHTTGGIDLFAWNQPHKPIVRGPFPPFIRTANIWDNWWVTEASATRIVVDAGSAMTLGHIDHVRFDNAGQEVELETYKGEVLSPWTSSSWTDWHNYHNRAVLLSYQRGYTTGVGTPNHVPVQVEMSGGTLKFAVPAVHKPKIVGQKRVTEYVDRHMKEFPPEPSKIANEDQAVGVSALLPPPPLCRADC